MTTIIKEGLHMNDITHQQKDLFTPFFWVVAALALFIFAILLNANPKNQTPLPILVKTILVENGQSLQSRSFAGRVQSSDQIDLSFKIPGQLVEFPVKEGQLVQQGQMIASLNPNEYQQALEQDKTKFHQISAKYNKAKGLIKTQVISQNDFNNLERDFESLKDRLNHSTKTLENTMLRAPFSGKISRKFVQNYQPIQAKQPIVSLLDPNHLEIVIEVPERVLPKTEQARKNLRFFAKFDKLNEKIPLELKSYGTQIDPAIQTYSVVLAIPKIEQVNMTLLPGMLATVTIEYPLSITTQNNAFQIPLSAIWIGEDQKKYVWVVEPSKMIVHKRQIEVRTSNQAIQVVKGLKKGDQIVSAGTYNLHEGCKVKLP